MRKLIITVTALVGVAFTAPSFAQSSQSAPQPGLPPGASFGAPNAAPPPVTGDLTTTQTQPARVRPVAPPPEAAAVSPAPKRLRRHHRFFHRRTRPQAAPAVAPASTAPAQ